MKKLFAVLAGVGIAVAAFGQGAVTMNTAASGAFLRFSNTVANAWAGSGVIVGLYWGDTPSTVVNLVTPTAGVVASGAAQGFVNTASGGGNRALPSRAAQATFFQLRAWTGGYATWEDAWASGDPTVLATLIDATPVIVETPAASSTSPVPQIKWAPTATSTSPLVAELVPVPEPSVIALGVLGLAGLLFIRRRK